MHAAKQPKNEKPNFSELVRNRNIQIDIGAHVDKCIEKQYNNRPINSPPDPTLLNQIVADAVAELLGPVLPVRPHADWFDTNNKYIMEMVMTRQQLRTAASVEPKIKQEYVAFRNKLRDKCEFSFMCKDRKQFRELPMLMMQRVILSLLKNFMDLHRKPGRTRC
jgi:hypothetical protein